MQWLKQHLDVELFHLGGTVVTPFTLLALAVTVVITALAGRLVRKATHRLLTRGGRTSEGTAYAVARIAQYVVFIGGVLLGLENIGVSLTALAALGALVSVGIGFGLQNIAQNFISGIILLVERPVQKGDFVRLGNTVGSVAAIEMRATRVITRDGISVLVPNSKLISDEVHNLSAPTAVNRLQIDVGVAYGSDTSLVRKVLLEVAERDGRVRKDPKPVVYFENFGDSSLDFTLAVWLDNPEGRPQIASDLRFAIDRTFRAHDIQIPFPQRDLHLVSGFEKLPGDE